MFQTIPPSDSGLLSPLRMETQDRVLALDQTAASRVADIHLLDPRLAGAVSSVNAPTTGVPRNQLTVPVSPTPNPGDTVLFEQPDDPTKKLYLPRYRIVDQPPLVLSLAQGAQDWTLSVLLQRYPAPELGDAARNAAELPHSRTVLVRYNLVSGGAVIGVKELPLTEVTDQPGGLRAVLRGTGTPLRDQLYLAMTDPLYAAALIVRRVATVAVPIPAPDGAGVVSSGEGVLRGTWMFSFDSGTETGTASADVWWEQMTQTQRQLVPQGTARVVNLGVVDFDSIDLGQLQGLTYGAAPIAGSADATNQLVPGDVFAVQTTGRNFARVQVVAYGYDLTVRWVTYKAPIRIRPILLEQAAAVISPPPPPPPAPTLAPAGGDRPVPGVVLQRRLPDGVDRPLPGPVVPPKPRPDDGDGDSAGARRGRPWPWPVPVPRPLPPMPPPPATSYRVTVYSDDEHLAPDPFVFAPTSSVFVNLGQVGGNYGLERNDVDFNSRTFSYYLDLSEPWVFYFLPDAFKLARRDESPHVPAMSIQLAATDDTLEHTQVTLTYTALPFVDPDRLAAAQQALASRVPVGSLPAGVTGPVLQALQVDAASVSYRLSLPGGAGFLPRDRAFVDLRAGIADSITMALGDFQSVYAALFSNLDLFQGEVTVSLGAGAIHTEVVRFRGRIADMAGAPPLDSTEQSDAATGGLDVVLKNAIESPLSIASLQARLARGQQVYPATVQGIDLSAPVQLSAGDSVSLVVAPQSPPVPGDGSLHALFDLSGVTIQPDPQKVWDAILDPTTPNRYARTVTVQVYASAFGPPGDPDPVQEVKVDFKQGQTVEVKPSDLPAAGAGPDAPEPMVSRTATLHLAISDYVLDTPQYDSFDYRVTTVRLSGSVGGDWVTVQHTDSIQVQ